MSAVALFSQAIDGLLAYLDGAEPVGTRTYPTGMNRATVRMAGGESLHAWFARCAEALMEGGNEIPGWQIAEDLAVFATIDWGHPGRQLKACSINVLKVSSTLEEYYLDPSAAYYLRMDYDYGTLGPMFTHPLPHVHAWPAGTAPRFVSEGAGGNVVVDFLEWVYRHFFHGEWLDRALRVCAPDFAKRYPRREDNPLERIFQAFNESQLGILREWTGEIQRIKGLLNERKGKAFSLRGSTEDRDLMAYP